jgi:DNA-directed RNA polymerase I subunit RPA49
MSTSSEKKRKRREDGGERPTKKVAIASGKTVKVDQLENKGALGPLLGMRKRQRTLRMLKY